MTRVEIITRFREENPEITSNVASDITLKSWLIIGNQEIVAKTRMIVASSSFDIVAGTAAYDLNALLSKFFDIDEYPGGGVSIVDTSGKETRLGKTTKAEIDNNKSNWRTESSGTPREYYRRNNFLHLRPVPSSSIVSINVDYAVIANDFNSDNIEPFNELTHLRPFHYSLVLYLKMRAKAKIGKPEDVAMAMNEYNGYITWIEKELGGGKYGNIYFRPKGVTPYRGYR